jgi:hypothetical protein
MAVFMNAKGTTNATYQIGKRGGKIFGGVSTPTVADVSTGDVWLDKTNLKTKIALLVDSTSGFNFDSERFVSNSTLSFVDSLMYNSDGSKGYTAGGGTLQQYSLSTAYSWNTRTIDSADVTTGSSATEAVLTSDHGSSSISSATDSAVELVIAPVNPRTLSSFYFNSS